MLYISYAKALKKALKGGGTAHEPYSGVYRGPDHLYPVSVYPVYFKSEVLAAAVSESPQHYISDHHVLLCAGYILDPAGRHKPLCLAVSYHQYRVSVRV